MYNTTMTEGRGRPSDSQRPEFGERLFELRGKKGFTQVYVAERLGISTRSYAFWERRITAIHAEQIAQLAEIFSVSADYLVGVETVPKEKRNGPKGKIEQVFESVHNLPKAKQEQIAGVVEALVAQAAS
jgi:transcriptional regulator with XRE-family HTH domain